MNQKKLALALASVLLFPAAGAAYAQSAPPANSSATDQSDTKQLQTVTVTGSAIPRVDAETPSPVTVISAKQIERSGYT